MHDSGIRKSRPVGLKIELPSSHWGAATNSLPVLQDGKTVGRVIAVHWEKGRVRLDVLLDVPLTPPAEPDYSKYKRFDGEYEIIPYVTRVSLVGYVTKGLRGGGFLDAVLSNDLQKAFGHADGFNKDALPAIVRWVYNVAPRDCHGSLAVVKHWSRCGGLAGSPSPLAA